MGKKILIYTNHVGIGGAQRVLSILANTWAETGNDIIIVQTDDNMMTHMNYELSSKIQVVSMPLKSHWKLFNFPKDLVQFIRFVRAKPDFTILCFLPHQQFLCGVASLFIGNRIVFSERNTPWLYPKRKLYRFLRNWSFSRAHACVFQTDEAMKWFSPRIQKKSVIIPNPVKASLPEPYHGERRKVIVSACRLAPQKNLPLLFHAFAQLHAEFPEYSLEIYGRGSELESLQTLKRKLGLDSEINLMGFSHHVHDQIRDAAMYVSSSDFEGISNSMLEALALGIPTISTDCPVGGARMAIQNGVNGLLVPVGDKQALYQAMRSLILNPGLAKHLGSKGTEIRSLLKPSEIADTWLELF